MSLANGIKIIRFIYFNCCYEISDLLVAIRHDLRVELPYSLRVRDVQAYNLFYFSFMLGTQHVFI